MKHGLEVFEFREEDELPENAACKHFKLKNPDVGDSGILKYEFLAAQSSAVQRTEINNVPCVDIDEIDCDHNGDEAAPSVEPNAGEEGFGFKERESGLHVVSQSKSTSYELQADLDKDNYESRGSFPELDSRDSCAEAPLPWRSQPSSALLDSGSSYESVDVDSEGNESMSESLPSSPASNVAEDHVLLNGNMFERCIGNVVLDNTNQTVDIIPDYVLYHDNYYMGSLVLFSPGGIKIEGPPAFDNGKTFSFEREIDDIVEIACQWSQRMGYVVIKLQVLSKDVVEGENLSGASGIDEVKFSSVEPNWPKKQETITSLNVKFMAILDVVLDQEAGVNEHDVHRPYFPNFDEPFEEVIYPKGDSDAVSISKRDVDLLQPDTFINDTIIDFYIKYLKNQIPPRDRHRFHFFNSFFFRKLADLDKDPFSISDGRAAFLRVHKWTRKVDIFGKDYIFIPVNFNLHWSLIVICHPGEAAGVQDEDIEKSPRVPCILHMDSIKGSHAGLKNLVQSYLWEEWKSRHRETCEDLSSRFLNLRFVSLELPQQENSFDCGLFLLHYLELFLADAPSNFSPFKIAKFSNFLNVDWFLPTEASLKRTLIQKLIFELLETHHQEIASAECNDEQQSSRFPEKSGTGLELLSDRCTPQIACDGNLQNSQAGQGIEMTLLETSSSRNLHCSNDSGMVLREFFEPGIASRASLGQFQSFDQPSSYYHQNGAISPGEQEDVEGGAEFVYLDSGENNFHQLTGTTAQACAVPYSSRGLMMDTLWNLGNSIQGEHDIDTSTETSRGSEDDDDDVGIIEPGEKMELNEKDHMDQQRSPSVENVECDMEGLASAIDEVVETGGTEASEDADRMQHGNEKNGNLLPSEGNPTMLLQKEPYMVVNQLGPDSEMAVLTCCPEASEDADVMQNGNEEDKDLPSSEENPTVLLQEDHGMTVNQLDQDSDLVENKEALCDSQIIGDGLLAEPDEQKPTERIQVSSPHEGELDPQNPVMKGSQLDQGSDLVEHKEATCDSQIIGDGLVAEPDKQKPTKRIRVSSPHEGELDSQNPGMTGNLLDQGLVMLERKEAICNDIQMVEDDLLAESDEQQPTKKIRLMSPDERKADSQEA